jgi:uncharacterized protein YjiK
MKIRYFLLSLLILSISCSQFESSYIKSSAQSEYLYTIRFPYTWQGPQGYGGDIDQQNFVEPSGICFHPIRKTLFVVSDEGEIAEIKTDGTPVFNLKIPGDLEGLTVNPQSGLLYVIVEGDDIILEFDPDKKEVTRKFPLNREWNGNPNYIQKNEKGYDNGIECIAFVLNEDHPEGGTFYVGNQWDPPCIMEVFVPLKTSQAKTAEARIMRVLPLKGKIDDPAAMYYDYKTGLLNIVSDADNILVELTLDGKLVQDYAFLGNDQEGLTRDDEGYLYIAQDIGGILKVRDDRIR